MTVFAVLVVVSAILLLLAAINWPQPSPVNLLALGLFFFVLAHIVRAFT